MDNKSKKQLSPEETLTKYFNAWIANNYQEMFELTQLTWQNDKKLVNLKQLCQELRLISSEIGKEQEIAGLNGDVIKDFEVIISYKNPLFAKKQKNKVQNTKIIVRLICEEKPFKASIHGQWGINPISTLRGFNKGNGS